MLKKLFYNICKNCFDLPRLRRTGRVPSTSILLLSSAIPRHADQLTHNRDGAPRPPTTQIHALHIKTGGGSAHWPSACEAALRYSCSRKSNPFKTPHNAPNTGKEKSRSQRHLKGSKPCVAKQHSRQLLRSPSTHQPNRPG